MDKKFNCYSNNHKPQITSAILKSIKRSHRLYKHDKSDHSKFKYKSYKNRLTKKIRLSEKIYYSDRFESVKGNIRRIWQTNKDVINGQDYKSNDVIREIKSDNGVVSDSGVIATKFNNFFSHIGPNLAKQIPSIDGNICDFLQGSFSNSMFVYDTDTKEICNIVSMRSTSSSKGFDYIAPKIVKSVIDEILCPLTTIFNISLQRGEFPDQLKITKIVPIYKSDDKQLVNNYRSISILPFFENFRETNV